MLPAKLFVFQSIWSLDLHSTVLSGSGGDLIILCCNFVFRPGLHMCKLDVDFTAFNSHDMQVCLACNRVGLHRTGVAAVCILHSNRVLCLFGSSSGANPGKNSDLICSRTGTHWTPCWELLPHMMSSSLSHYVLSSYQDALCTIVHLIVSLCYFSLPQPKLCCT